MSTEQTPTPETDAAEDALENAAEYRARHVSAKFARRLERERNEARSAYEEETKSTIDMAVKIARLESERAKLEQLIVTLKNDNQHLQERLTGIRNLIIARNQIGKQIRDIAGVQTWEGVRHG